MGNQEQVDRLKGVVVTQEVEMVEEQESENTFEHLKKVYLKTGKIDATMVDASRLSKE